MNDLGSTNPIKQFLDQRRENRERSNKIQFPVWPFLVYAVYFMAQSTIFGRTNNYYKAVLISDYIEVPLYLLMGGLLIVFLFLPLFRKGKKKQIHLLVLLSAVILIAASNLIFYTSLPSYTYDQAVHARMDDHPGAEGVVLVFPQGRHPKTEGAGLIGYDYVVTLEKDGARANYIVDPMTGENKGEITDEELYGPSPSATAPDALATP